MAKRVSVKGKGADLFFGDYDPAGAATDPGAAVSADGQSAMHSPAPDAITADSTAIESSAAVAKTPVKRPRAKPSSSPASNIDSGSRSAQESKLASVLANVEPETIEAIRKVVKTQGREVSFIRLTPEEKAQVSDIVYTYKRQGQKTTENQINRIAINYLLHDYHERGEQSVLARVLASLLA